MKIFALVGLATGLINLIFTALDPSLLRVVGALAFVAAFVCLFVDAGRRSKKTMNLFAVFLAVYVVAGTIRLFTEKGYF